MQNFISPGQHPSGRNVPQSKEQTKSAVNSDCYALPATRKGSAYTPLRPTTYAIGDMVNIPRKTQCCITSILYTGCVRKEGYTQLDPRAAWLT